MASKQLPKRRTRNSHGTSASPIKKFKGKTIDSPEGILSMVKFIVYGLLRNVLIDNTKSGPWQALI